jgi:hypothetical protein
MERTRTRVALAGVITVTLLLGAQAVSAGPGAKILEAQTMVGVPAGLTGAQALTPLRGIAGGGIPWTLASGKAELSATGHLEIKVRGLVLATGANAGSNPAATFRGLVSCVRADGTFANILTDPFPATTGPASAGGGNSKIEATVALPSPCIAPIVFVTSAGGSWFAATGR